jgi:TolB-like protein/Tfp pilus assembly protein PilF
VAPLAPVTPAIAGRVMLAVLPFRNLSDDPAQEFFSEGLTDEMIAQLSRFNPEVLGVIAPSSAMRYKNTQLSIGAIGRELGVSCVVEGSVRQSGGRVRVTVHLVDVTDQTPCWSYTLERAAGDILSLQRDLANAIATEIGVQLVPAERKPPTPRAVDPGAYEAYLKARYYWKRRTRQALERSVQLFREAIAIDPTYAPAFAGLADVSLTQLDYNYLRPRDAFALADAALVEALRLDNTLAEPQTSLGHLRLHQFDWAAAERQFRLAIDLNPGYDTAHYYYANLLAALGRFDEALVEANRALALDPISANTRQNRLFILYLARRYSEALRDVLETLEMDPSYTGLYYYVGLVCERQGDFARALDAFQQIGLKSQRRGTTVLAAIGYTQARAGDRPAARATLETLGELSTCTYVPTYEMALLHLALGERELALKALAQAYEQQSSFLPFLNVDARFDELRGDPRFEALIDRLAFPRPLADKP